MNTPPNASCTVKFSKWKRRLKRCAIAILVVVLFAVLLVRNHIRTLASLKRVPGTNAFVMDYYVDYHLDEIQTGGMDVHNIEDSFIKTFFPDIILPIAQNVKRWFIAERIETIEDNGHHCSSLFMRASDGTTYFAHNLDYSNDAFLILRVHDKDGLASIALIDLAYLNLNRQDLDSTNLIQRIPLLFAPYYAFDGVNRHGVAVGIMSVGDRPVVAGYDPNNPNVISPTLMRIILDNATSAEHAYSIAQKYNVHFVVAPLHVLIGDSQGQSGILEHIDGEVKFIKSTSQWQVCTNHQMYETSEEESDKRCDRYREGSSIAERLGGSFDAQDATATIRSMSVDGWTMWTSIYNLTSGEISVIYKERTDSPYYDRIDTDR